MKTKFLLFSLLLSLNLFFGQTWTNYNTSNSGLQDANVTSLALDNSGNLWIGTYYNGLIKFDGTTFTKISTLNTGFTANRVYCIYFDGATIWAGTGNGLFKQNGNNWIKYTSQNSGLSNDNVNSIIKDNNGNYYFGTDGGLYKFVNNTWSYINSSNSNINDGGINSIAIKNNILWVAIDGSGVSKFDGSIWTNYDPNNSSIHDLMVMKIAIDNSNKKWFGGYNNGIKTFDDTNWQLYHTTNSQLISNQINDIAFDGNYEWIATDSGLNLFNGTSWKNYTNSNSGLGSNNVSSIIVANNGIKWFGLFGGGITKLSYSLSTNDEINKENIITIHPNPVKNTLNISSKDKIENYQIFDSAGRLLLSGKNNNTIEVSSLQKGVYTIKINNEQTIKFIKE